MIDSLITEVEHAVANGDQQTRMAMLRRVTQLFSASAPALNDPQVEVFDAVISKLSQNVETIARAALSRSLADERRDLRHTMRDLAFDEAASVAVPVLSKAECITDADLVQIASERGQDHLFAISRRRRLSERVTDVLVVRGDQSVVRSVAGNDGASFSEAGFNVLSERASADEALRNVIELRKDVPPHHIARIAAIARERAAERLAAEFSPADVSKAVTEVTRSLDRGAESSVTSSVNDFEQRMKSGGIDLDEKQIATWVNEGKTQDALIALAKMANVPPAMAFRAFQAQDFEPLLFLIRSVKFGWGTFKLFLQAKPGWAPKAEDMRGAFEAFQALSIATAQRVVRFTSAREQIQKTDAA